MIHKINVSIHGTSNSVRKGWKDALLENTKLNITNYSIGACCSGVALCSSLKHKTYNNDINILELTINDNNWLLRDEITEDHIKKYIDGLFELMLVNSSKIILLIMPDKKYIDNSGRDSIIARYYEDMAKKFNVPVVNGYEYINILKQNVNINRLFFDKLHLHNEIALYLGKVVNGLVEYLHTQCKTMNSLSVNTQNMFYYVPAAKLTNDSSKLKKAGTSLRTEEAVVLDKNEKITVKTIDSLCGLFIDTNNSKALLKITGINDIVVNTYRSECTHDKTQFYYLPIRNLLKSKNRISLSIVDKDTQVTEKSLTDRIVDSDNNSVVLFGMLFLQETNKQSIYYIIDDNDYQKSINYINRRMEDICKELKDKNNHLWKKIFIHIGMHKTGSSSIQESLYSNLKNEHFYYIPLIGPNHSGAIQYLFRNNTKNILTAKVAQISKNDIEIKKQNIREKLLEALSAVAHTNMILSGEGIIHLTVEELNSLKSFFESYLCNIQIIGYVRPPTGYITSAFQQRLKMYFVHSNLTTISPSYRWRVEKFDKVFGKENVILWKFDPKNFPNGDVTLDFCEKLGIDFKADQTVRVNESLSKEAVALLYTYRKYGPEYGTGSSSVKENNALIDKLAQIGKSKFKFSPSLIEPLLDKYRTDIEWMENRLGESLEEEMKETQNDIKNEEDLLQTAVESVEALKKIVDLKYIPKEVSGKTPEEVAIIVHALRLEIQAKNNQNTTKIKDNTMVITMKELVEKLKEEMPKMDEKVIKRVSIATLQHIKKEIDECNENVINISKLGKFRKQEIEKDGKKYTRTFFISAVEK